MSAPTSRRFRFFQWNDLHVRDRNVPGRTGGYPGCNEKAAWLAAVTRGEVADIEPPDFVASVGDLICGQIDDYGDDFRFFQRLVGGRLVHDGLEVPVLPCVGNHENRQGEGVAELNAAYDTCHGPGWHNYLYTVGGFAFVVVDTSGAHRTADDITAARCAFVERAVERAGDMPVILLTHVPLVAMRQEEALIPSFGFSSWKVVDESLLDLVTRHADRVVAVLCGHIHITGVRVVEGVYHVMPSGTAGYPADFASYDVYEDRIDVVMHRAPAPLIGDREAGNIHGARRHGIDYTDAEHSDHESYLSGNPGERSFSIPLEGARRPDVQASCAVEVFREDEAGYWRRVDLQGGTSLMS